MLQRSAGQGPVHAQRKLRGNSRNEHLYIVLHLFQTHTASIDFSLADKTVPSKASTAILVVGDIFGTGSQVMQVQLDSLRFIIKQKHCFVRKELSCSLYRGQTFLLTVVTRPISIKSSSQIFCVAIMPTIHGFRRIRLRRVKPLVHISKALPIRPQPWERSPV